MASNENRKIEDSQNIFRMRCKVTKTKMNMKHLYNSYECRACYREYENDKHVLECTTLLKMNKEYEYIKVPEYDAAKIFSKRCPEASGRSKNQKINTPRGLTPPVNKNVFKAAFSATL